MRKAILCLILISCHRVEDQPLPDIMIDKSGLLCHGSKKYAELYMCEGFNYHTYIGLEHLPQPTCYPYKVYRRMHFKPEENITCDESGSECCVYPTFVDEWE